MSIEFNDLALELSDWIQNASVAEQLDLVPTWTHRAPT
jgi:hypothetical protein